MAEQKKLTKRAPEKKYSSICGIAVAMAAIALLLSACAPRAAAQGQDPVLTENTQRVSPHVSVIMGFPNVAIVVGTRATLVVDTGLGPRNGATITRAAFNLANHYLLYLTTTHFHPEHASGDSGFPLNAILVRPVAQQKELEQNGMTMVQQFADRNAQFKQLLAGTAFRPPDIVFDKEITLDLGGGVTARLFWLGTAHTLGDEMIFVEPDKTLIPGDVVQSKMLPNLYGPDARLNHWIEILAQLKPLAPRFIVPDHGALGDGSLIDQEYGLLSNLQTRALELKKQGKSADEAGKILEPEFKMKYPDWPNLTGIPGLVQHIYSENP